MDRERALNKIRKDFDNRKVFALVQKYIKEENVSSIKMLSDESIEKIVKVIRNG